MRAALLTILLVALAALAPAAAAHPLPPPPTGDDVQDVATCLLTETVGPVPYPCPELLRVEIEGETYYVSGFGVYREANGCDGLQSLPGDCDGDGEAEPSDDWQNLADAVGPLPAPLPAAFQQTVCVMVYQLGNAPQPECGVLASFEAEGQTYYVAAASIGPYRETNGCEGLQTAPSDCDGDGDVEPRDHHVRLDDLV